MESPFAGSQMLQGLLVPEGFKVVGRYLDAYATHAAWLENQG